MSQKTPKPCKIWEGSKDTNGYGRLHREGKWVTAHRDAWEKARGPLGVKRLRHTCGRRDCVELSHLEVIEGRRSARTARGLASRRYPGSLEDPRRIQVHVEAWVKAHLEEEAAERGHSLDLTVRELLTEYARDRQRRTETA